MQAPKYLEEESQQALANRLALDVAGMLREAITLRGQATLVVSGGSTPVPFLEALSLISLDWQHVAVTLADERWLAPDHADSNERLVRTHLLKGVAAAASFVSLYEEVADANTAQAACAARIRAMGLPFDAVILGMGGDGHTASLFPAADRLAEAVDPGTGALCMAMQPPEAPHQRMTLTLAALLNTRNLLFHITGDKKREVLEQAIQEGSVQKAPVCALFFQSEVPVSVYWSR